MSARVIRIKTVIFAGGKGVRFWPLSIIKPKPLLPIANSPMLERVLENIDRVLGIKEFIIITNYKSDQIEEYCGGLGFDIEIVKERKFLGTAGGLKLIEDRLDDDFVVWNSDTFAFFDARKMVKFHKGRKALATICTTKNNIHSPFGEINNGANCKLKSFVEKPVFSHMVNIGIYALKPKITEYIAEGERLDMNKLMERAIRHVYCYDIKGLWVDVGNIQNFVYANRLFLNKFRLEVNESGGAGFVLRGNYVLGKGVTIGSSSIISDSSIGNNVKIGANTEIESSIIFQGSVIGSNCKIKNSIIGYNSKVSDGTFMDHCTIAGLFKTNAKE